ncbi:NrsF family protein [Chenggangzhangella methanolivorans]|uniref:NrsF family protein n=1 Tax=Chenggangzhangella methanolivorans TaxID=1437009 RepID=A0A9E6REN3_9HYPH|nr:NrsF family protein [Chenggangzhangella methanolivorans]QZO02109.1 NrsF family protein [Chenggangzhangella methanolivorans]
MFTTQLIDALVADAGSPPRRVGRAVAGALLLGAAGAAAVFAMRLSIRPDIVEAFGSVRFPLKFALMAGFALAAAAIALRLSRPGRAGAAEGLALAAAAMPLLVSVAIELLVTPADRWTTRAVGTMSTVCLTHIPLLAAPALVALLTALRRGAPASPALTGAAAGLLAGAMAAMVYATSCPDDSPLFVAIWYMIAIGLVTAAGALAGSRLLRW